MTPPRVDEQAAEKVRCGTCGRVRASQEDWSTFDPGEGEHLCWDGMDTGCEPVDVAALAAELVSLKDALGKIAGYAPPGGSV